MKENWIMKSVSAHKSAPFQDTHYFNKTKKNHNGKKNGKMCVYGVNNIENGFVSNNQCNLALVMIIMESL